MVLKVYNFVHFDIILYARVFYLIFEQIEHGVLMILMGNENLFYIVLWIDYLNGFWGMLLFK